MDQVAEALLSRLVLERFDSSAFSAALAGEELAGRPRIFCSSVLDTVIATVPANPATSPYPIPFANDVSTFTRSLRVANVP